MDNRAMESECGLCLCGRCNLDEAMSEMKMKIDELHEIVMNLVKGISAAQQSGGMAGMMARQLPDMTGVTPVTHTAPYKNGV